MFPWIKRFDADQTERFEQASKQVTASAVFLSEEPELDLLFLNSIPRRAINRCRIESTRLDLAREVLKVDYLLQSDLEAELPAQDNLHTFRENSCDSHKNMMMISGASQTTAPSFWIGSELHQIGSPRQQAGCHLRAVTRKHCKYTR